MQLLLLTTGLGLTLAVLGTETPLLIPATAEELFGKWYIRSWAGNLPIPEKKKTSPLPPFMFGRSKPNMLEFRMNLRRRTGCIKFQKSLDEDVKPGVFYTWWKHTIYISFLPGRNFAIAYFEDNKFGYKMMMLMGRSLEAEPESARIFEEFVESKGLNKTRIASPPSRDACELPGDS